MTKPTWQQNGQPWIFVDGAWRQNPVYKGRPIPHPEKFDYSGREYYPRQSDGTAERTV